MYILHAHPSSQHSRRVVSLLEEAGLDYDFKLVDLMKGEHMSPPFLEINPNHQVPALIDGDIVVCESNAILRYLCHKHKLDNWYPQNASRRAVVDQWLDWGQCRLSPAVVGIVLNKVFLGENGDSDAIEKGRETLKELSPILNNALGKNAYLGGEQATIADLALVSNIYHLGLADEIPKEENIQRWYKSMLKLSGVQKSLPEMK